MTKKNTLTSGNLGGLLIFFLYGDRIRSGFIPTEKHFSNRQAVHKPRVCLFIRHFSSNRQRKFS